MIAIDRTNFFSPGRSPLVARECAVATSHPLATAAGLEILSAGGNAVDAAIAAVATQSVVEPHMTGIGGDCFVLYATRGGATVALNGSGRAPAGATLAAARASGLDEDIPRDSAFAVTVPGAISAWIRLHTDHGRLPLDQIFRRAIDYAENGYPVTPRVALDWALEAPALEADPDARALFLPGGAAPRAGDRHAQPLLGRRLRDIAANGAAAFYEGAIAESMVRHLRALGGTHTIEDFADGRDAAFYETPISTHYRGVEVEECPPNGQGLAALMILNILKAFDLGPSTSLADRVHIHAEAVKLVYHHRDALICDPASMTVSVADLLSDEATQRLARRIDMSRARPPVLWHEPEHSDTVYLCVVDRDGNMVSFINSIFDAFGSTRLDPATGVLFHSRGSSFRLLEGHPNALAPRKRPMHTIIPGLVRRDGRASGVFGVMGGHYQAAGQAAFLSGLFDRGLDPQAALDAPRSFAFDGVLELEPAYPEDVLADLAARGHVVRRAVEPLGGGQAIFVDEDRGILVAGSDGRKDGSVLGF